MPLSITAKIPIYLPKWAKLTKLIIMAEHVKSLHAKNNVTLSMIREKYWIPQGARTVMNAIKGCPVCKKFDAVPFRLPKMGKLPLERSTRTRPFEYTEIDMFGPLRIKNHDGSKGKIWGIIFTCMTTRLTYIDVVSDASAFTFIQTLQRFVARNGQPTRIYSDHGTNFRLAQKSYAAEMDIKWVYITTNAPWSGGFYESIVKLSKNCLRRAIGRRLLDYNAIITLLTQTEAVLNSRPLSYSSEVLDQCQLVRPIDFIRRGFVTGSKMLADDKRDDPAYKPPTLDSREQMLDVLAQEEKTLNKLWAYFYEDYLKSLRERQRLLHQQPKNSLP